MTPFGGAVAVGLIAALVASTSELSQSRELSNTLKHETAAEVARAALWNEKSSCKAACVDESNPLHLSDDELSQIGRRIQAHEVDSLASFLRTVIAARSANSKEVGRVGEEIVFPVSQSGQVVWFQVEYQFQFQLPCMIVFCQVAVLNEALSQRSLTAPPNMLKLVRLSSMVPVNPFQARAKDDALRFFAEQLVAEYAP